MSNFNKLQQLPPYTYSAGILFTQSTVGSKLGQTSLGPKDIQGGESPEIYSQLTTTQVTSAMPLQPLE